MATINAMKSKRLLAPASHPEEGVDVVVGEGPGEVEGITEEENEGLGDETFE